MPDDKDKPVKRIELRDLITDLKQQVWEAAQNRNDDQVKLDVKEIELELHVAVSQETNAQGGIKFWVFNMGMGAKEADVQTQVIRLRMTPDKDSLLQVRDRRSPATTVSQASQETSSAVLSDKRSPE